MNNNKLKNIVLCIININNDKYNWANISFWKKLNFLYQSIFYINHTNLNNYAHEWKVKSIFFIFLYQKKEEF